MDLRRSAAVVSGVWAGVVVGLAVIGAPAAFAVLQRSVAGAVAGRMFAQEAYAALAVSAFLVWAARRLARSEAVAGSRSIFSAELMLALGVLFCTLFGYFGLQPLMAAAREGQGSLSFGALHGASAACFGLKGLLLGVLAWRLARGSA